MQLVEQTVVAAKDARFQEIDQAAFAAKNLYNAANYLVRQSFIFQGVYLNTVQVYHLIKAHETYKALPAKVSNAVLNQVHRAWVGFFRSLEENGELTPRSFWESQSCPNTSAETGAAAC